MGGQTAVDCMLHTAARDARTPNLADMAHSHNHVRPQINRSPVIAQADPGLAGRAGLCIFI